MTTLQRPDGIGSGVPGEEDPMELSLDFDRRYLGDDDIDIDLDLDGKSPYNQEDEFMLEEDNSVVDGQSTYEGPQDNNDDEMIDEVSTPHPIEDKPQDSAEGAGDENSTFEILVDDEELVDAEDTISISEANLDYTSHISDLAPSSSKRPHEDYGHEVFPNETDPLFDSQNDGHDFISADHDDTRISTQPIEAGVDRAAFHLEDSFSVHDQPIIQMNVTHGPTHSVNLPLAPIAAFSTGTHAEQNTLHALDTSTHDDSEYISDNDESGLGSIEKGVETSPYHTDENADENANENANENVIKKEVLTSTEERAHVSDVDILASRSSSRPEKLNSAHNGLDIKTNKDELSKATGDDAVEHHEDDSLQNTNDQQEHTNMHPVVVVYQNSEIYLFPPHEHEDEQSQTFFLQDESIAHRSIEELLQACRAVLADSISDQDELEIIITPLALVFCETCPEAASFSLSRILEMYLQLHQNDGNYHPQPLQMTLTTKLRLTYRLQYLHNAIAGGLGIIDVAVPEQIEDTERPEDPSEYPTGNLQENGKDSSSESGKPEMVDLAELHEERAEILRDSNQVLGGQEMPKYAKLQQQTLERSQDEHTQLSQIDLDANDDLEEIGYQSGVREHDVKDGQRNDELAAIDDSTTASSSSSVSNQNPKAHSSPPDYAGDIDYNEQEELQESSATSSTLKGDASDRGHTEGEEDVTAGYNSYVPLPNQKSRRNDEVDETPPTEPYYPDESYGLDIGFDNPLPNDHMSPDLSGTSNDAAETSSVTLAPPKETSRRASDAFDEINYDEDEEYDDDEAEDQDHNSAEHPGDLQGISTAQPEIGYSRAESPLLLTPSLKRARADEDDALISTSETSVDLKRQRST